MRDRLSDKGSNGLISEVTLELYTVSNPSTFLNWHSHTQDQILRPEILHHRNKVERPRRMIVLTEEMP